MKNILRLCSAIVLAAMPLVSATAKEATSNEMLEGFKNGSTFDISMKGMLLPSEMAEKKRQEEESAQMREKVKKELMYDCLESSSDKYELYYKCIGKVFEACDSNYRAYEPLVRDIDVGPVELTCRELEANLWSEIGDEYTEKLTEEVRRLLKDKEIDDALTSSLEALKSRQYGGDCLYEIKRWGGARQGLYDDFHCMRDNVAEGVIRIYLWLEGLKNRS